MYSSAFIALAFATLVSSVRPPAHILWLDATSWRLGTVPAMKTVTMHRPCAAPVYTVTETVRCQSSTITTHVLPYVYATPPTHRVFNHTTLSACPKTPSYAVRPWKTPKPSDCGNTPCKTATATMRANSASSYRQTTTTTATKHHVASITSTETPNPDLIPPLLTSVEAASKSVVHTKSTYTVLSGHQNATHALSPSPSGHKPVRPSKTHTLVKPFFSTDVTSEISYTSYITNNFTRTVSHHHTTTVSHHLTKTLSLVSTKSYFGPMVETKTMYGPMEVTRTIIVHGSTLSTAASNEGAKTYVPTSAISSLTNFTGYPSTTAVYPSTTTITWESKSASEAAHAATSALSSVVNGTSTKTKHHSSHSTPSSASKTQSALSEMTASMSTVEVETEPKPHSPLTSAATAAESTSTTAPAATNTLASGSNESITAPTSTPLGGGSHIGKANHADVMKHCNEACGQEKFCVRLCMKHKFYKLPSGGLIADIWR
jgi:hypothetical protein